jgi:hypothetical protein
MSSASPEPKSIAFIKRGRSNLAVSVKTKRFADSMPTKRKNVIQKAQRDSLRVPREDPKERVRFHKVVEAG